MATFYQVCALATFAMLSGCSTEPAAGQDPDGLDSLDGEQRQSRPGPSEAQPEEMQVEVYSFEGTKVGTSPPSSGSGPEFEEFPPEEETFEAPAGTKEIVFDASWPYGQCWIRIEVRDEAGTEVYHGFTHKVVTVGPTTVGSTSMNEWSAPGLGPGVYTVQYYVAGSCEFGVWIHAILPADPLGDG